RINALKPCSIESYIKNYEIEHILPQTPQPELLEYYNQLGTNYEQLRSMLGDLTLLEQPINGSIHNDKYSDKVKEYAKKPILLAVLVIWSKSG
ncbi:MAG: HNH endonuclease family protein, partial [Bacteroidales bacterium]|nr:HNH endonuclease family protein [Bacteroidales bacterium]